MEDLEIWKPVVGYEGIYEVSSHGRIKSLARLVRRQNSGNYQKVESIRKLYLKTGIGGGYLTVPLCREGVKYFARVHRIVAEAFCEKPEGCNVVNHLDNDKENNHYLNLEWTTPLGNTQHAVAQGRNFLPQGEKSPAAKLTYEQVKEIRVEFAKGVHYQILADKFGVFKNTIWSIVKGDTWDYPEAWPDYDKSSA